MESDNLRTASLYINNQLLSRGLLRNGQTIEFARPDKDPAGTEGTMGRIMSVVNDLILRRDRDAQQREALAQTIRTLRADSLRQTTELERLSTKNTDAQRRLGVAEATERSLKLQIRSAEHAARVLKEEMGRMKLLVGQTRAQCANEVRKRERVIEGMKKHVGEGGRARGSGKAPGVTTINVVAGIGAEGGSSGVLGTEDSTYDLRTETNEFLTELAKGLSDENENLGGLVRRTVDTLRTLSGYEKQNEQEAGMVIVTETDYEVLATQMEFVVEHVRNLLTNPSFVPLEEVEIREDEIIRLRDGWEKMEGRWREAVEMMDGWRKRMTRSGQTVNLEELKMGLSLSPLKTEENSERDRACDLSTLEEEEEDGEGDTQADIDAMDDSGIAGSGETEPDFDLEDSQSESSLFEDEPLDEVIMEESEELMEESEEQTEEIEEDEEEVLEETDTADVSMNTASSISLGPPPQLSPLRETSPNKNKNQHQNHNAFTTIIEENTLDLLEITPDSSISTSTGQDTKSKSTPTLSERSPTKQKGKENLTVTSSSNSRSTPTPSARRQQVVGAHSQKKPPIPRLQAVTPRSTSRLPRPRDQPPQQSPLTMASIAAKLAATEREADAARVRAKIKAARSKAKAQAQTQPQQSQPAAPSPRPQSQVKKARNPASSPLKNEVSLPDDSGVKGTGKKRKAVVGAGGNGRANRRRSTLSPWELESLILGNLGEITSPVK